MTTTSNAGNRTAAAKNRTIAKLRSIRLHSSLTTCSFDRSFLLARGWIVFVCVIEYQHPVEQLSGVGWQELFLARI